MGEITVIFKNYMKNKWRVNDEQLENLNPQIYTNQLDSFNYAYALQQEKIDEEKRKHNETKKQLEHHRKLYYSAMRNR